MKRYYIFIHFLLLMAISLAACSSPIQTPTLPAPSATPLLVTSTPTQETTATLTPSSEEPLYVNILWHQHQPLYYKDENGVYTRPWVRVHGTKDYYDMAATVAKYPNVHVTFNLTPVLLRQLADFVDNGAKDLYWVMSEKPTDELSLDDKTFILQRFFDVNWQNIVARFPRYQELLQKRGGDDADSINSALQTFTEQDFRDLQVWFNLAWFDPDFLNEEPLKSLVDKGENFSEEDKVVIFDQVRQVLASIVPIHKQLQDAGQIEVITTPYAHPILPLIYNTNLALVGNPDAEMPDRFSYPNDAIAQLDRSVEIYSDTFGQPPRGLWPGEGAVAEEIVPMVAQAGYKWMASGEPVLAQSLGIGSFTRDSQETVQEADELYRPYYVQGTRGDKVAIFFRDWVLSDKVGFTYSGMPGEQAAQDLINRLENIRSTLHEQGAVGPHIVSIILDGENAWEYYQNDGKEFLNGFYQLLSESKTLKTVTPSEYMTMFPEQKEIQNLFPGAWFSPNYDTWIGEDEERDAWNYLGKVRSDLAEFDIEKTRSADPESIALAEDFMYLAEGSDWFWWYGGDQDSGQDEYFDQGFRSLLAKVYQSLGEPVPSFVDVPIIPRQPSQPTQPLQGLSTPVVDGIVGDKEWDKAASYPAEGKTPVSGLWYGVDAANLYLRLDLSDALPDGSRVGFYFSTPGNPQTSPYPRTNQGESASLLGFPASHLFEWHAGGTLTTYLASEDGWQEGQDTGRVVLSQSVMEFAIPWDNFGELETGDLLNFIVVVQPVDQFLPSDGPAQITFPDLGLSTVFLSVDDPQGDDYGPGSYVYPTDAVFQSQVFDLQSFSIALDEKNLIFNFAFYGPIPNPWGSPNNLALQTLDVYVDKDPGASSGSRLLMPGRNAALSPENGWEYAIWAEGWTPQIVAPDADTGDLKQVTGVDFKIIVDPSGKTVSLRVPLSVFGEGDPTTWGYAAAVLSQDGFPSTGVWRVRDIESQAAQWRFGGGSEDTNHTRIIDYAWPESETPTQEEMLSTYQSSSTAVGDLSPDDYPQVLLLFP